MADPARNEFCVIEPGADFLWGTGYLGEVTCEGPRESGRFWRDALAWPLVWDRGVQTAIQSPAGARRSPGTSARARLRKQEAGFDLVATDREAEASAHRAGAEPVGEAGGASHGGPGGTSSRWPPASREPTPGPRTALRVEVRRLRRRDRRRPAEELDDRLRARSVVRDVRHPIRENARCCGPPSLPNKGPTWSPTRTTLPPGPSTRGRSDLRGGEEDRIHQRQRSASRRGPRRCWPAAASWTSPAAAASSSDWAPGHSGRASPPWAVAVSPRTERGTPRRSRSSGRWDTDAPAGLRFDGEYYVISGAARSRPAHDIAIWVGATNRRCSPDGMGRRLVPTSYTRPTGSYFPELNSRSTKPHGRA